MILRLLAASVCLIAIQSVGAAQTWTSPDGFLTVTAPDAETFTAVPSPPDPFIALWVSRDESMRFGVARMQIPPEIQLIQSSAEEGFANEIGGKVRRLPAEPVSGHEVWKMKATAQSVEATQAMVRHGGTLYKVMAATVGREPDEVAIDDFVNSLSIAQPMQESRSSSVEPEEDPQRKLGGGSDMHNLSMTLGGAGALLGIACVAYLLIHGRAARKQ